MNRCPWTGSSRLELVSTKLGKLIKVAECLFCHDKSREITVRTKRLWIQIASRTDLWCTLEESGHKIVRLTIFYECNTMYKMYQELKVIKTPYILIVSASGSRFRCSPFGLCDSFFIGPSSLLSIVLLFVSSWCPECAELGTSSSECTALIEPPSTGLQSTVSQGSFLASSGPCSNDL